jgi:heme oxygenase (mycobilin-producing)
MIVVTNRVFVKPEFAETFETAFRNRPHAVDDSPGFLKNEVLRPLRPDAPYLVVSHWASQADFETWVKSDAFKKAHSGGTLGRDAFAAPSVVEMREVMS